MSDTKRILLIIGGGIAAYKCLFLIRELKKRGIEVRAILTKAGHEFVTPLSVSALTGEKVFSDLFDLTDEAEMGHIELSRSADLVVVAPATADLMAKPSNGMANDLASTALLATDKPVLYAPAMNVRMWEHPGTQRNIKTLEADGAYFVGPDDGDMACGEYGPGRMAEPEVIAEKIETLLGEGAGRLMGKPLEGRHILITAGPTREPIDPVRYLSNHSSGRQGYAIARACAELGADVTLVTGPTALRPPSNVNTVHVETAREMLAACESALPADVAICVAAVADWRPVGTANKKIKKNGDAIPPLELTENPDILKTLSHMKKGRPEFVVGFAAETNDIIPHARAKLAKKGCDLIVANDVSGDVMGGLQNAMIIVRQSGEDTWPRMSKTAAAQRLAALIANDLK